MLLIPVIDLLQGQVVHARRGERDNYQPIHSSLCAGSAAGDIVSALLALHPFSHLYIADLDAIQKNGENINIINELHKSFPSLKIWLDAGVSNAHHFHKLAAHQLGRIVLGSETLQDLSLLTIPTEHQRAKIAPVLSLDFFAEQFRGPDDLQHNAQLWPADNIVMSLSRVGADTGPDFDRLSHHLSLAQRATPRKNIYAAGGVRHIADLMQLRDMGVAGALIASALHDGRITRDDLKNVVA